MMSDRLSLMRELLSDTGSSFRYHFCQREAIETLVYLVEIWGKRDAKDLIDAYATMFNRDLLSKNIVIQTKVGGVRQIRRYVPEVEKEGVHDLPPENLRRYAFKMATGSGKTWVMAMAIVWSRFTDGWCLVRTCPPTSSSSRPTSSSISGSRRTSRAIKPSTICR